MHHVSPMHLRRACNESTAPERIALSFTLRDEWDPEIHGQLQQKGHTINGRPVLQREPPDAQPLNIRVEDETGHLRGGLAAVTYWDWLVIKLLVLDDALRGRRLGQHLLYLAHQEAQARGCTRAQTTTYDFQALNFYLQQGYQIVGSLEGYPEGYTYHWVRYDFEETTPRPKSDLNAVSVREVRDGNL